MTQTGLQVRSLDNSHGRNEHTHNTQKDKCMENIWTHKRRRLLKNNQKQENKLCKGQIL